MKALILNARHACTLSNLPLRPGRRFQFRALAGASVQRVIDWLTERVGMTDETRKALGAGCDVLFDYSAEIEPNATGKHRITISHVHQ